MMRNWYEVDKEGLRQILGHRDPGYIVLELVANACDTGATTIDIVLEPVEGVRSRARLYVEDDDPDGFADLTDTFTVFAPSRRKADPSKRGRFNLGEKLVLAHCETATIVSTTGGVRFDAGGRHRLRRRRECGSSFEGVLMIGRDAVAMIGEDVMRLIPPVGVTIRYNGVSIDRRDPIRVFRNSLPTVIADEEGTLRRSRRIAQIELFQPAPDRSATIFEMGIPIVDIGHGGDPYDINIADQKVPLSMDRDSVTPGFLRELRTLVANAAASSLNGEDFARPWAIEALGDPRATAEAVSTAVQKRFGDKVVTHDPRDPEASKRATAEGFTVIYGATLPKEVMANVRRAGIVKAATADGMFATPHPFEFSLGGGHERRLVPEAEWTCGMRMVADFTLHLASRLLGMHIRVVLEIAPTQRFEAWASPRANEITFNVGVVGRRWFESGITQDVLELILHELAHLLPGAEDHLSAEYHQALSRLGAGAVLLAAAGELPQLVTPVQPV